MTALGGGKRPKGPHKGATKVWNQGEAAWGQSQRKVLPLKFGGRRETARKVGEKKEKKLEEGRAWNRGKIPHYPTPNQKKEVQHAVGAVGALERGINQTKITLVKSENSNVHQR